MPDRFDVVVAGAGHNSLIAAAYLAKAGFRCLVLEGRPVVGGNCVTEELTLRSARYYLPLPDPRNSDASLEERLSDGAARPHETIGRRVVELYTTAEGSFS
jgi:phytoene dehydrogenase-like protein